MAVGDVVSSVSNVAALGTLNFQPAAGVECKIPLAGGQEAIIRLTNGANFMTINNAVLGEFSGIGLLNPANGGTAFVPLFGVLYVNNSVFLSILNPAVARDQGYCGIQIK